LLDRQAIVDCLYRYCRGIDRKDKESLRSTFHDDAVDVHGRGNVPIEDFAASLWLRQEGREVAQHFLTNISVDVDGDTAHTESYFLAVDPEPGSSDVILIGGRYVDRLERRNGEWRVVTRVTIPEWSTRDLPNGLPVSSVARTDREDPSYERPLVR
jgi:hypothetical protein